MCDSKSYCMICAILYLRKESRQSMEQLPLCYVREFSKSIHRIGKNLMMGNWFMATQLTDLTLWEQLTAVGTLRKKQGRNTKIFPAWKKGSSTFTTVRVQDFGVFHFQEEGKCLPAVYHTWQQSSKSANEETSICPFLLFNKRWCGLFWKLTYNYFVVQKKKKINDGLWECFMGC
jgi:hypothetical protein